MNTDDRFEKIYSQGVLTVTEIWVDRETGVQYIWHQSGYAGGLTPLLKKDGTPVIQKKRQMIAKKERLASLFCYEYAFPFQKDRPML